MSRTEKVRKLANAIRDYRGAATTPAGTPDADVLWKTPPKKSALSRVHAWIGRLKLDYATAMEKIESFKSFDEFNSWLKTIG